MCPFGGYEDDSPCYGCDLACSGCVHEHGIDPLYGRQDGGDATGAHFPRNPIKKKVGGKSTPTEKQLEAIQLIEKNLPYIKFVGTTSQDAFEFISANMEKSKEKYKERKRKSYLMRLEASSSRYTSRPHKPDTDTRNKRERYEEYIEKIAPAYNDLCSDGWGGSTEHIEIARKLHPFEEWDEL